MQRYAPVLFALLAFSLSESFAFDANGYRSGMSPDEVSVAAKRKGLSLIFEDGLTSATEVSIDERGNIKTGGSSFIFCDGYLVSYVQAVSFDRDYIAFADQFLREYGNPSSVTVQKLPMGVTNVIVHSMAMRWYWQNDRIDLFMSPDVISEDRHPQVNRSASIVYASKNKCWSSW